jgi:uncharacterized membrane protein
LGRVVLAYILGGGLLGTASAFKKKYANYSAVLLSGSVAIMYFTFFVAYGFYDLIPQTLAFIVMVGFTVFTVYASLKYDQSIIAHIGLVGAYAIPFFLSDNDDSPAVLFAYVAIIN